MKVFESCAHTPTYYRQVYKCLSVVPRLVWAFFFLNLSSTSLGGSRRRVINNPIVSVCWNSISFSSLSVVLVFLFVSHLYMNGVRLSLSLSFYYWTQPFLCTEGEHFINSIRRLLLNNRHPNDANAWDESLRTSRSSFSRCSTIGMHSGGPTWPAYSHSIPSISSAPNSSPEKMNDNIGDKWTLPRRSFTRWCRRWSISIGSSADSLVSACSSVIVFSFIENPKMCTTDVIESFTPLAYSFISFELGSFARYSPLWFFPNENLCLQVTLCSIPLICSAVHRADTSSKLSCITAR